MLVVIVGAGCRENLDFFWAKGHTAPTQKLFLRIRCYQVDLKTVCIGENCLSGGETIWLFSGDNLTRAIKTCWFPSIFSNKAKGSIGISYVLNFNIPQWECSSDLAEILANVHGSYSCSAHPHHPIAEQKNISDSANHISLVVTPAANGLQSKDRKECTAQEVKCK